jgi:heat shock protein HslJ
MQLGRRALVAVAALAAIGLVGWAVVRDTPAQHSVRADATTLDGTAWQLVTHATSARSTDVPPSVDSWLKFDGDRFTGRTCNRLSGTTVVTAKEVTFRDISQTKMGCQNRPDAYVEIAYLHVIDGTATWSISDDDLVLTAPDGASLRFRRLDALDSRPALEHTDWRLLSRTVGGETTEMPSGVPAILRFDGSGQFSADAACNRLSGRATLTPEQVTFADANTTDVGCAAAGDVVQRALGDAAEGTRTWTVDGTEMTLHATNGDTWLFRAEPE